MRERGEAANWKSFNFSFDNFFICNFFVIQILIYGTWNHLFWVRERRGGRLEKFNFLLITFLFIFFSRNICNRERGGGRLEKFWCSFDNFLIYFYLMFLKFEFKFVELETFCFGWEREERRQIGKVSIFLLLWIKNFIWTHLFLSICNLNLNLWKLKPFVLDPKEDWRQIGKVE